jgi:hypothetical protein
MALGIESYRVVLTGSALGATVGGVDLRDLHDAVFARMMHSRLNHTSDADSDARRGRT